jgi:hypothetical protein
MGLHDTASGVRGWNQKSDVGLQPLGNGLFYLATDARIDGKQSADLRLMRWTGDAHQPVLPVDADLR